MNRRLGYTLIELITVLAITAVLLVIIVLPVFQSFNLTRQAQSLADAQEMGRRLTERVAREVSNAVAVRGGSPVDTVVNNATVRVPSTSLIFRVPRVQSDGSLLNPRQDVDVTVPFTRMDLVQAAQTGRRGPGGGFIDPVSGREDPTLSNFKGQTTLPIAPGATITRWWVGLRDPFRPYTNPYDGLLTARSGERDNLFVLYRAEVQPRVFRTIGGTPRYVANADFFAEDANLLPILDDPRFFTPNVNGSGAIIDNDAHAARIRNWLRKAVVQTELSRYDMLQAVYNLNNRRVANTAGIPQFVPLVQFRPTRVSSEPTEGQLAVRLGEEVDNGSALAPDTFTTRLGLWSSAVVRTWPAGWNPAEPTTNAYLVGRLDQANGSAGAPNGFSIYAFDPDNGIPEDFLGGTELFDVDGYERALAAGQRYPFSVGVNNANARSNWLVNAGWRRIFTPYWFDSAKGRITASFNISEVGNPNTPVDPANPNNLPTVSTGPAETPRTASDLVGEFDDPKFNSVNARFNKVWDLWERDTANTFGIRNLDQSRIHRFIDLRIVPMGDGTRGPLDPQLEFQVGIVPGSDVVTGPDQNPGPNFGLPVRYVRVNGTPGPNQYRINYTNLPEPADYTLLGLSPDLVSSFNGEFYQPDNFVSAIIQSQFRAGYIQLNSDPNAPIPPGNIRVSYRFQFTGVNQTSPNGIRQHLFAVDYDSRELMSILLTIRNYPQSNQPNPQSVTLKASAKVRNYIR
jgi:prepilin-type N-terminal cleavage/methylation domain-containing protein